MLAVCLHGTLKSKSTKADARASNHANTLLWLGSQDGAGGAERNGQARQYTRGSELMKVATACTQTEIITLVS